MASVKNRCYCDDCGEDKPAEMVYAKGRGLVRCFVCHWRWVTAGCRTLRQTFDASAGVVLRDAPRGRRRRVLGSLASED